MTNPLQGSVESDAAIEDAEVNAELVEVVEPTEDSEELTDPTEGAAEGQVVDDAHGAYQRGDHCTEQIPWRARGVVIELLKDFPRQRWFPARGADSQSSKWH